MTFVSAAPAGFDGYLLREAYSGPLSLSHSFLYAITFGHQAASRQRTEKEEEG